MHITCIKYYLWYEYSFSGVGSEYNKVYPSKTTSNTHGDR